MSKSSLFFLVFIIVSILTVPLWDMLDAKILKAELKEALNHFVVENCEDEIEILDVDSPYYTSNYFFSIYESWLAKTNLDGKHSFSGSVSPKALYVSMSNTCDKKGYLLNRKNNRFEEFSGDLPIGVFGGVLSIKYLFTAFCIGLTGFFIIRRLEGRYGSRNNKET